MKIEGTDMYFDDYKLDDKTLDKSLTLKKAKLAQKEPIRRFMIENGLDIDKLRPLSYLEEYLNSLEICEGCQGLYMCKQEMSGHHFVLEYNGSLTLALCECPFLSKKHHDEAYLNNFVYSNIPKSLRGLDLDNIKVDVNERSYGELYLNLLKLSQNELHKGLYISGSFGVGKTYLSIAFINTMAKKGHRVAFLKTAEFVNMMRNLLINDKEDYEKLLEAIKSCDYLVFDDFGTETLSSYSRDDLLFTILDHRMENELCTLFTSNLTLKALYDNLRFDKNMNVDNLRAARMMERVKNLALEYVLKGNNKRNKD